MEHKCNKFESMDEEDNKQKGIGKFVVRGDTHGEEGVFIHLQDENLDTLDEDDILFVTGDFGYCWDDSFRERKFRRYMAEDLKFTICFVDGNHENFDLLNSYPVEMWNGGKVHIIERDKEGTPKLIHLMRGQVYEISGKKIFSFGGGDSRDKWMRREGFSWWPQEMPTDDEKVEAIGNLKKNFNKVDYILTHAAPEYIMRLSYPDPNRDEAPLNNFLQWIKDEVEYEHWYFGHLHLDRDYLDNITCCLQRVRNMADNSFVGEEE